MDTIDSDNKLDLVDTGGKSVFIDTTRQFHLEERDEPQNDHKSENKPDSVDNTDESVLVDTEEKFQLEKSNEPQNEQESENKPVSVDNTDESFFIDTEGQLQLKDSNEPRNELDSENKIAISVNIINPSFDINEKEQFRFEKGNEPRNVLNICYSDTDSVDSDSDSTSTGDLSSETSSDSEEDSSDSDDSSPEETKEKKAKTDYSLTDLPPIEELRISVPEDACIEIGTVTNIVDTLVIVESYKGTPALDVDSVLFLDCGKRTLGKVFDILGPVTEPVYAVRFNNQEQIKNFQIEKGLKVYCAPKTEHTSFVFLSEILKHKGSDASWKDNIEAPSEFQDFSDDEEERRHKMNINSNGEDGSRKRPLNKSSNIVQPARFRPAYSQPRPNRFPNNQYRPFTRPNPHQVPMQPFHYNVPLNPGNPALTGGPFAPPMYFTSRFPPPIFPTYGFPGQRIQQPFHQQRIHPYPEGWRPQYIFVPPPPPPPPPPAPLPTESESGQNSAGQS